MRAGSPPGVFIKHGMSREERLEAPDASRVNAPLLKQQIFFAGYLFADGR